MNDEPATDGGSTREGAESTVLSGGRSLPRSMTPSRYRYGRPAAGAVLVLSTLVLVVQFRTPSPVVVATGGASADVAEVGSYFTYWDVGVVAVAACLLGASATALLLDAPEGARREMDRDAESIDGDDLLAARRRERESIVEDLADAERAVYEAVLDADGVRPQSEIVEETDLSKASVSRALDGLESKGLVERKRRGMGNVVVLR